LLVVGLICKSHLDPETRRGQLDAVSDRVGMKGPGFMSRGNPMSALPRIARGCRTAGAGFSRRARKGVASVLAMLYLVIFATLAVGFAEASVMNAQISRNERNLAQARASADAGLAFARYYLGSVTMPVGTTNATLLTNVATQLGNQLNNSADMGGNGKTVSVTAGSTIYLPSQTGWVLVDSNTQGKFRITITANGANLVVTSQGSTLDGAIIRGEQVQFQPAAKPYALIGTNAVTLSGPAFTDSYDASKGAYNAATAHQVGSIASNGNITLSNTVKVNGDARYGTASNITIKDTASVTGLTAPLTNTITYPSVTMPAAGTYTDLGDVNMSSGTVSIGAGTYVIHNLTLSGTATINWTGVTKMYILNSYNVSGGVVITTYQNLPKNRTLYFLPTCTTASWSGTNVCVGDLYAPDTDFTIGGSVDMMGRIVAKSITNSSSGGMHYDESLPAPNGQNAFAPVAQTFVEVR